MFGEPIVGTTYKLTGLSGVDETRTVLSVDDGMVHYHTGEVGGEEYQEYYFAVSGFMRELREFRGEIVQSKEVDQ